MWFPVAPAVSDYEHSGAVKRVKGVTPTTRSRTLLRSQRQWAKQSEQRIRLKVKVPC